LLQVIMDLHAGGLARLLQLLAAGDPDGRLLAALAADEQVRALLLLHGLHPQDLPTRVRQALAALRPHLGVLGLRLILLEDREDDNIVRLRIEGRLQQRGPGVETLQREIEDAILQAAPDVAAIEIEGLAQIADGRTVIYVPVPRPGERVSAGIDSRGKVR
jgi:hypothetical protein